MDRDDARSDAFTAFMRSAMAESVGATVIYRALTQALRSAIEQGVLKRGANLPGEREISESFGISRTSVRRAIETLVDEGVLVRRQGARTVVASRVEKPLASLTSFSEDMRSRGLNPGMVWLEKNVGPASPAETMALNLSVGQPVSRLRRVRIANGNPMAIETAVLPSDLLPDPELVTGSLYEFLAACGRRPVRALQRVRASIATIEDMRLLELAPGAPILVAERRCFGADERPVEFTRTRYCGDRYDFMMELVPVAKYQT